MRRRTADETREALIAAAIRLMDRRSVADVTVKDIAAEAGVNHGLVHRYFGSKEGLIREAVAQTSARVNAARPTAQHSVWFFGLLQASPEIARILARCCMDGPRDLLALASPPREALEAYVQPLHRLIEHLGLEHELDPYVLNAFAVSGILGWIVFRPLLEAGFGLPPDAEARAAALARLLDEAMGPWYGAEPPAP